MGETVTDVRVQVPAGGQFLQVIRNVVAAVGARAGCSVDVLADLRLAVDEAATRLLRDVPGAQVLVVEATRADGGLAVSVAVQAEASWPSPELAGSMGWQILTALVHEAEATRTVDGPAITFRVRADG